MLAVPTAFFSARERVCMMGALGIVCLRAQARIKQLYKKEPTCYVSLLPPSPVTFLRDFRALATEVFSAEAPPVSCPFMPDALEMLRSRICMRGGGRSDCLPMSTMQGFVFFVVGWWDVLVGSEGVGGQR